MPISIPDKPGELFDNADSFGMVFDAAFKRQADAGGQENLSLQEKKDLAIQACSDHPFFLSNPQLASQVADFRLRLFGL
ncbi:MULTISPECIES: hypothetical protein [unclassified Synechococcus]|jgi:hypothetical protein|uniref:hypothetical protein n=1 Tax=unclassified Synechococcus TaxID=2626047 RepID=UPI002000A797|nr:hypothetical protein [Synechococcus sp. A10-1-5-1]UPM51412.1 hypothetical protein MY494_06605 [Synechococcus sp. A10-1-5-1]